MYYVKVEFEPNGPRYVYSSPFKLNLGQITLVNVYGVIRATKVVARCKRDTYPGKVNSIIGLGYTLEELQQPTQEVINKPTMMDRLLDAIT